MIIIEGCYFADNAILVRQLAEAHPALQISPAFRYPEDRARIPDYCATLLAPSSCTARVRTQTPRLAPTCGDLRQVTPSGWDCYSHGTTESSSG